MSPAIRAAPAILSLDPIEHEDPTAKSEQHVAAADMEQVDVNPTLPLTLTDEASEVVPTTDRTSRLAKGDDTERVGPVKDTGPVARMSANEETPPTDNALPTVSEDWMTSDEPSFTREAMDAVDMRSARLSSEQDPDRCAASATDSMLPIIIDRFTLASSWKVAPPTTSSASSVQMAPCALRLFPS